MSKESNNNNNDNSSLEDFISQLDITLANIEKLGTIFLILGYSIFFYGADLDILENLELNTTPYSPDEITFYGQEFVLTGYILLTIVAYRRFYEKAFRNKYNNENFILGPYWAVANAYLLSAFANAIRVEAFYEIYTNLLVTDSEEDDDN